MNTKIKYDDFGEVVWQEPKRRRIQKLTFSEVFKQLGKALF